jgi:very-short-patch-repair endonuclease
MEGRKYPRDFLLAELKRVARALGKIPTIEEFRKEGSVSPETLAARFKGWKGALSSAGFDPQKARLTYQDVDMLEELRRVATTMGRTPATTEFDHQSLMSASTISQRFGSWKNACEAAGLKPFVSTSPPSPPTGWNRGQRKLKISEEELRYLYEREGLSAAAIASRYGVSMNSVFRVMKDYGIESRRLHYSMPRETTIESLVYAELERRGVTFVKQQVIDGLWVADAIIPGARMVIECDGEYWHSLPEMQERDRRKDAYLKARGYKVLRFPEAAIRADVKGCVQRVVDALIDRYKRE